MLWNIFLFHNKNYKCNIQLLFISKWMAIVHYILFYSFILKKKCIWFITKWKGNLSKIVHKRNYMEGKVICIRLIPFPPHFLTIFLFSFMTYLRPLGNFLRILKLTSKVCLDCDNWEVRRGIKDTWQWYKNYYYYYYCAHFIIVLYRCQ